MTGVSSYAKVLSGRALYVFRNSWKIGRAANRKNWLFRQYSPRSLLLSLASDLPCLWVGRDLVVIPFTFYEGTWLDFLH